MCLGGGVTPNRYHPARRTCIGSLPSGQTSAAHGFETACAPAHSRQSDRRGGSAQCPNLGCSPRVRPFPPRPPPEVAFLCSVASSVLRPHPTSHPRTYSAYGYCLPEPARTSPGTGETSQVPHKELLHVRKVSDCARFFPCKPLRHGRCCLLVSELALLIHPK